MKVSVIITTHNRRQLLSRALQSTLSQDFNDFEVVVVNDCSTDGTWKYLLYLSAKERRLRVVASDRELGSTGALNVGLRVARGKYIAVLDDDDYWTDREKLKKQVEFLERNAAHVAVGTNAEVIIVDQHGTEVRRVRTDLPQSDEKIRDRMLLANSIAHVSSMYRQSVVEQLGGYDERLERGKDWDLFLKLGKVGKLANLPDVTVAFYEKRRLSVKFRDSLTKLRILLRHRKDYPHFFEAFAVEVVRCICFGPLWLLATILGAVRSRKVND